MEKGKTDLSTFSNPEFKPGRSKLLLIIWYMINRIFFASHWLPHYGIKSALLRLFGAKVGKGVCIKPGVSIKFPWKLKIGNNVWIGENVWIDNLTDVLIGDNVCISQGAFLLCGSHNYKKKEFDLLIGRIELQEGVWIAARAVVTGGVCCYSHSILTANSVTSSDLEPYMIYKGNPAIKLKERKFESSQN
jgi:putative colanic acid biosynthesis acetyltransferase WcaF